MNKSVRITIWSLGGVAFLYAVIFYLLSVKMNEAKVELGIQYNISQIFPDLEYKAEKIKTEVGLTRVVLKFEGVRLFQKETEIAKIDKIVANIPVSSVLINKGTNKIEFRNTQLNLSSSAWETVLPQGSQEKVISQMRLPNFLLKTETSVTFKELYLVNDQRKPQFVEKLSLKNMKLKRATAFELRLPMLFDREQQFSTSASFRYIGEVNLASLFSPKETEINGSVLLSKVKVQDQLLPPLRGSFEAKVFKWKPTSVKYKLDGDGIQKFEHESHFEKLHHQGSIELRPYKFLRSAGFFVPAAFKNVNFSVHYNLLDSDVSLSINPLEAINMPFLGRSSSATVSSRYQNMELNLDVVHSFEQGSLFSGININPFSFNDIGKVVSGLVQWNAEFREVEVSQQEIMESIAWLEGYSKTMEDSFPSLSMNISCTECTIEGKAGKVIGSLSSNGDQTNLSLSFVRGDDQQIQLLKNNGVEPSFVVSITNWTVEAFEALLPKDLIGIKGLGNGTFSIQKDLRSFSLQFKEKEPHNQRFVGEILELLGFEAGKAFQITELTGSQDSEQVSIERLKIKLDGASVELQIREKSLELNVRATINKKGKEPEQIKLKGSNLNSLKKY